MVWYSHLFQNFPQLIVIHTVKGFGIVNKAEIDVFLELSCFFHVHNFSSKEQVSFNFMASVTICSDFGAPQNKVPHCFPSLCHEVMGPDAMILVF